MARKSPVSPAIPVIVWTITGILFCAKLAGVDISWWLVFILPIIGLATVAIVLLVAAIVTISKN